MAIRNTGRRASSVTSAPSATEDDVRVRILNSFLSCPHRDTEKLKEIHDEIRKQDPLFYAHLACILKKERFVIIMRCFPQCW